MNTNRVLHSSRLALPANALSSLLAFVFLVFAGCRKKTNEQHSPDVRGDRPLEVATPPSSSTHPTATEKGEEPVKPTSVAALEPMTLARVREQIEAVQRLGENPSRESIAILLQKLMTVTPISINNVFDIGESYPASAALTKIGVAAVPQITKRFEETTSEREHLVLLDTLVRIKGKNWVLDYLSQVDKQRSSAASTEQLSTLRAWVKSL